MSCEHQASVGESGSGMDRMTLLQIDEELGSSEVAALCFLCRDVVNRKRLEGVRSTTYPIETRPIDQPLDIFFLKVSVLPFKPVYM